MPAGSISITKANDGYRIVVEGASTAALGMRSMLVEIVGEPASFEGPDRFEIGVPSQRITLALLRLAPYAVQTNIALARDAAAEAVLQAAIAETAALRAALAGDGTAQFPAVQPSANFHRPLKPHQAAVIAKLIALPHGANFSVPGAGKTTVLLAVHDVLRARGLVNALLVVAPRNAFRPWEEEAAACFASAPKTVRLTGGAGHVKTLLARFDPSVPTIFLVSYQQAFFARDVLEDWFQAHDKVHFVLDESHRIKNPRRGAWATTVIRLGPLASRRDILTGTPAPNALEDLGTQLEFLWPHVSVVSERELAEDASEDAVSKRLRGLFVRTTKKQLALPATDLRRVPIGMGSIQSQVHQRIAYGIASRFMSSALGTGEGATLRPHIIRLLQLASNPALILSTDDEFKLPPLDFSEDAELDTLFQNYSQFELPNKFAYVAKTVSARAAQGKKTLVWSSFVKNTEMMGRLLEKFGAVVLHGGVPTALESDEAPEGSREQLVDRFKKDPACLTMIANPAACSESISLHQVCDFALYVDRTFNAAAFLQSMDRIHRLGGTTPVTYELLVSPGTIDDVVDRRLQEKVQRLGKVLDDEALRSIDLDSIDDSSAPFDDEDATQVIEFLRELRDGVSKSSH